MNEDPAPEPQFRPSLILLNNLDGSAINLDAERPRLFEYIEDQNNFFDISIAVSTEIGQSPNLLSLGPKFKEGEHDRVQVTISNFKADDSVYFNFVIEQLSASPYPFYFEISVDEAIKENILANYSRLAEILGGSTIEQRNISLYLNGFYLHYTKDSLLVRALDVQNINEAKLERFSTFFDTFTGIIEDKETAPITSLYLTLNDTFVHDEAFISFISKIVKFDRLQVLAVEIFNCTALTDESFKALGSILPNFKNVEFLKLSLGIKNKVSKLKTGLSFVTKSLEALEKVKSLNLNLAQRTELDGDAIHYLGRAFEAMKELVDLSINLKRSHLSEDLGKKFFNTLNPLTKLEDLDLNISGSKVHKAKLAKAELEVLAQKLSEMKNLQRVRLNFNDLEIENSDTVRFMTNSLVRSKDSFTQLALKLRSSGIYEQETIIQIFEIFRQLTKLTEFELNFEKCEYKFDENLNEPFNLKLDTLVELRTLKLNFSNNHTVDNENQEKIELGIVKSIGESITKMLNLEILSIDLGYFSHLIPNGFSLSSTLKDLKKITDLSLNFYKSNAIIENELSNLGDSLNTLNYLESLNLNFGHCSKISDDDLSRFFNALEGAYEFLRTLDLNFYSITKLSNRTLNSLGAFIGQCSELEHIRINLAQCYKISNGGVSALGDALSVLKIVRDDRIFFPHVKQLDLKFDFCKNVEDSDIRVILEGINEFYNLQIFNLSINNCPNVTENSLYSWDNLRNIQGIIDLNFETKDCPKFKKNAREAFEALKRELCVVRR